MNDEDLTSIENNYCT